MMASKFIANPQGMAAFARSTGLVRALKGISDQVADNARDLAPIDEGDYRDGIVSEAGISNGMAISQVQGHDWKSALIEFGTVDTPVFAPIRRGVERAGLKLVSR